jgi:hypothetical protein
MSVQNTEGTTMAESNSEPGNEATPAEVPAPVPEPDPRHETPDTETDAAAAEAPAAVKPHPWHE